MTEAELLRYATQYYPEWSVSKQEYQPTDIGSMNANIDLFKDESGLIKDWVLGVLTGSFDYGLLQPQQTPFEEAAPSNALSQKYRTAEGPDGEFVNAKLFEGLDAGMTAQQAAMVAYAEEAGLDEAGVTKLATDINENQPLPGNYTLKLEMAKSIEKEVAEYAAWEQRLEAHNASAPAELNEIQKEMQAAGFSTELTPDSWFSDSIDQDRIDEAELYQQMWDLANVGDFPELSESVALPSTPTSTPTPTASGSETDFAITPQAQTYVRDLIEKGVDPGYAEESVRKPDAERNMELYGQPYAPNQNTSWHNLGGIGDFFGNLFGGDGDGDGGSGGGGARSHPRNNSAAARIAQGEPTVDEQMLNDVNVVEMLGGDGPLPAPTVPISGPPTTIASQNMEVPFNPETHYAPTNTNTLPDFNGPKGGMPRNGGPSGSGPVQQPSADAARYQGMADLFAASMAPTPTTPMPAGMTRDEHRAAAHKARGDWAATASRLMQEEREIARARSRGSSIQQKQMLDRLLGLPRG